VQTLKEALSSIMNDDKLDVELDPQKVRPFFHRSDCFFFGNY